jgi:hypothetical protein
MRLIKRLLYFPNSLIAAAYFSYFLYPLPPSLAPRFNTFTRVVAYHDIKMMQNIILIGSPFGTAQWNKIMTKKIGKTYDQTAREKRFYVSVMNIRFSDVLRYFF